MEDHRSPGGYRNIPSSNKRYAWGNTDDQYSPTSPHRYTDNTNARHGRETGRHSQTTEQEMDVDSSDDTRREKMPMKKTEELLLKLEGLPTLIQNSKQELRELREWKQSLSTRSSDETLKLKEEIEKLKMENQTLKTRHHDRISSNRSDEKIKALEQELQKAKQTNEEYKNDNSKVVRECQYAEAKIKNLEQTVADYQLNQDKIKRECESVKEKMSALQNRYKAAMDEKTKIEKELSESKTRLSRMMGNKLGDNNPDIADLSDKNRPTKLAEKNTELYDNEWTDAFEVFQTKYTTEKETIEKLLQMLQDIKVECDQIAQEQIQKLTEAMKLKQSKQRIPDHIFKQLKDFRRFTAEESLPEVIEKCSHKLRFKDYRKFLSDEGVLKFFKGCVELCWFMNVQDPPLLFGHTPKKNDEFDCNYFKFYTSTGSKFEYMVWPALLLKENGAILSKGVAQASLGQKVGPQKPKNRRAETGRNGMESGSYGQHLNERPHQYDEHGCPDSDTNTTHSYHGNDRFSLNHERQNVHDKNYQQSVVGNSHPVAYKKTFSKTLKMPGNPTVADKMSKNFGSSQREPDNYKYPLIPNSKHFTKFIGLLSMYDMNSTVVIKEMGENYEICKNYYLHIYGKSESVV